MTTEHMGNGGNVQGHEGWRVGKPSRRWPDGRPLCGAKKRAAEGTCTWTAGQGTKHYGFGSCVRHGGNTPNHNIAAQRVLAERAARTFGLPVDIDATEALLDEVRWSAGHVVWLRGQVQAIDPEALVWGMADEVDKGSGEFPGVDVTRKAAPSVWVELYQRERKHLLDVCKTVVSLRIEEQRLDLAKRHGAALADVVQAFAANLGLTAEQAARVPVAFARALESVTGIQAPGILEGSTA